MPGMLGEALFVAHKLRDEMLFRAPVGTVLGVVTMVVRPHHHWLLLALALLSKLVTL